MKKNIILCLATICFLLSCDKEAVDDLPPCVNNWIELVKKGPVFNGPARVYEYEYGGKTVYLTTADCCDQFNLLIDKECNPVCAPSGGISGKGDGKCADFNEKSKLVRLVWEDNR
jgi:hypothetical protein